MDARARLLVSHGADPIAYSTLQPGLEYFETSYGYVAYAKAHGLKLTLGPPVCADADRRALAEQFMREPGEAAFFYVPHDFAALFPDRFATGIGVDKVLTLGRGLDHTKPVRGAVKKAKAAGLMLERVATGMHAQLHDINARYLEGRSLPYEMRFLNRPMQLEDDGLALQYALRWREDGVETVRGYARLNPWFKDGRVAGYLLDVLRFAPTKLWGVFLASVAHLIGELERQGVGELSLGYCPLHRAETEPGLSRSAVLDAQVGWLSRHLAEVPYVARLREQKSAFPTEDRQRYMVTSRRSAVRPFLALMSASGVSLRSLLGVNLVKSLLAPYRS